MKNKNRNLRIKVVMLLAKAWHGYGVNSFRAEAAMTKISQALGLEGQFFFTPTYIAASFRFGEDEVSRIQRVFNWEVNLEKLCLLDEIASKIIDKEILLEDAVSEIEKVTEGRDTYPNWLIAIVSGLISLGIALLWGGDFATAFASFSLGSLLGIISSFSKKFKKVGDIADVLGPFLVALLAGWLSSNFTQIPYSLIVIAGVIVLLPGLNLTVAMAELATNHLASGSARLMGAITVLFKIALGTGLGFRLSQSLFGLKTSGLESSSTPLWELIITGNVGVILAIILLPISISINFQTKFKDIWISYFIGLCALIVCSFLGNDAPREVSALVGGAIVGTLSNSTARILNKPASLGMLPGLILLVPGSIGYRSLDFLFNEKFVSGLGAGFTTFAVATSIVAGLFLGNLIVNPRRNI